MKKTFKLTAPNKTPERLLDSIKHEIKKYVARERKKTLPENYEAWEFDCKIGLTDQDATVIKTSEINTKIDRLVLEKIESFYIEILAKPTYKRKKS